MLGAALELLGRLLKERDENRQLVLEKCIEPLKHELDDIQRGYVERLSRFRSVVERGGPSAELIQEIETEINTMFGRRSNILSQMDAALGIAAKRVGTPSELSEFLSAVDGYLALDELRKELVKLEVSGAIAIQNPYYSQLKLRLFGSEELQSFIGLLISETQEKYSAVVARYAKLKTYLLTDR